METIRVYLKKLNRLLANKWVNNALLLVCGIVFIVSLFYIARWVLENRETGLIMEGAQSSVSIPEPDPFDTELFIIPPAVDGQPDEPVYSYPSTDYLTVDFTEWKKKNPDTVGWVWVRGTKINYPVVQAKDNDYYLDHNFEKKKSSAGWMFGDYRNDFKNLGRNTIIYGHARIDRSMLGSLYYTQNKTWYSDPANLFVRFNTLYEQMVFQVFSIYVTDIKFNYIKTWFSSDDEYVDFLKQIRKKNTTPLPAVSLTADDRILTFSTCTASENKRLVMHAKLIKTRPASVPLSVQ